LQPSPSAELILAWIYLLAAGLFEIGFTTAFRHVDGFKRLVPLTVFIVCITCSLYLFNRAARDIPLGTAYAVWGGIGVGGTAILGMVVYQEPMTAARMFFLSTLVASIIGLRLVSN
jgi:quaternary ammonium compound-resistance protein SugE